MTKKWRGNVSVLLAVPEGVAPRSYGAGTRAEMRGGIQSKSASGFSLKKVRISFRVRSQVVCWRGAVSVLRASAGRFASIFQGISAITETSRSRKMRFAIVKQQNPALRDSQSFFSPLRASCKAIISACLLSKMIFLAGSSQ